MKSICTSLAVLLSASAALSAAELQLPGSLATHADGRAPVDELYRSYLSLQDEGWLLDIVYYSQPPGRVEALPIIALRTAHEGDAVWIFSGIHGEETAGPMAIAGSVEALAELGRARAVVLLPLNNPQGYAHNWRYLNTAAWSPEVDAHSVGDSSHLLPDPERSGAARAPHASSPEADALTAYVLEWSKRYPPSYSIDLHEDNLIDEGYVYSQGLLGADDPLARRAVDILLAQGVPLKLGGETRFGEPIHQGIIGPVTDSSIDELMSARTVILGGRPESGPGAQTVLVFETPAAALDLERRVDAHSALLRMLPAQLAARP